MQNCIGSDAFRLGCGDRMCDLGSAAVFSPDGAYTSIAPPATPGRRANLTHSVPQGSQTRPTQGAMQSHPPRADKEPNPCFIRLNGSQI